MDDKGEGEFWMIFKFFGMGNRSDGGVIVKDRDYKRRDSFGRFCWIGEMMRWFWKYFVRSV